MTDPINQHNQTPSEPFESFATCYQSFVGEPDIRSAGDDEPLSSYPVRNDNSGVPKRSFLANPILQTGLLGAGSIAATLAVGFLLTEGASSQLASSHQESPTSPQPDSWIDSEPLDESAAVQIPTPVPPESIDLGEFESERKPYRELLAARLKEQQWTDAPQLVDAYVRALTNQSRSNSAAAQSSQPASDAATQTNPSEAANASGQTPQPPVANQGAAASRITLPNLALTPAELPPEMASEAPAQGQAPEVQPSQDRLHVAIAPSQSLQALANSSPNAVAPDANPAQSNPPNPPSSQDANFAQATANQQLHLYHAELFRNAGVTPAGIVEPEQIGAAPTIQGPVASSSSQMNPAPATAERPLEQTASNEAMTCAAIPKFTGEKSAQTPISGIHSYLALSKQDNTASPLGLLSLTAQAAADVADSTCVEQFWVYRLSASDYQQLWETSYKGNTNQSAPTHGFISYAEQVIILPVQAEVSPQSAS